MKSAVWATLMLGLWLGLWITSLYAEQPPREIELQRQQAKVLYESQQALAKAQYQAQIEQSRAAQEAWRKQNKEAQAQQRAMIEAQQAFSRANAGVSRYYAQGFSPSGALPEGCDNEEHAVRMEALSALSNSEPETLRPVLEQLLTRDDKCSAPLRERALMVLSQDKSPESMHSLRKLYPKVASERLKTGIIRTLMQDDSDETRTWLLSVVRDAKQPLDLRCEVLTRLSYNPAESGSPEIKDLVALYDAVDARELHTLLIAIFSRRSEEQATEKLFAIASSKAQIDLRRQALGALSIKQDPRARELLMEIVKL